MQDIVTLRKQLKQCGAHTYPSPWPGCCQVIVLPEQLINKVDIFSLHPAVVITAHTME